MQAIKTSRAWIKQYVKIVNEHAGETSESNDGLSKSVWEFGIKQEAIL